MTTDQSALLAEREKHLKLAKILGGALYGWNSHDHATFLIGEHLYEFPPTLYRAVERLVAQRDKAVEAAHIYELRYVPLRSLADPGKHYADALLAEAKQEPACTNPINPNQIDSREEPKP